MKMFDTIAAIATPLGSGGVAIIRVSGADSEKVSQNVVKTKSGKKPVMNQLLSTRRSSL